MGGVVLAVGALMVIAGAYEMYVGSGDILSERGWSAFIAGAILVGSGIVAGALGLVLRALKALRDTLRAQSRGQEAPPATESRDPPAVAMPTAVPVATVPSPSEPRFDPAPTAPVLAAAPLAHALRREGSPPRPEPRHEPLTPAVQGDWLDDKFSELEREISAQNPVTPPAREAFAAHPTWPAAAPIDPVHHDPAPEEAAHHEPALPLVEDPAPKPAEPQPEESLAPEPSDGHESHWPEPALEVAPPAEAIRLPAHDDPPAQVIGRYESEGTSYVMYADGSIDAQSEAGVYRFASMAELKAFIES